jgi:hypothetical protein
MYNQTNVVSLENDSVPVRITFQTSLCIFVWTVPILPTVLQVPINSLFAASNSGLRDISIHNWCYDARRL